VKQRDVITFLMGLLGGITGAHFAEPIIKFIGEICEKI
jgi:hypothetical protein